MDEGQKKRNIGRGMKPRGNKRVKPQKEKNPMSEQSTVEGHETASQKLVLEGQEGNETPGNLEPENGEKALQNLESSEATVARDEDRLGEPSAAGEELLAAMQESAGEVIDAEFKDVDEPPMGVDLETERPGPLKPLVIAHLSDEQIGSIGKLVADPKYGKIQFTPTSATITEDGIKKILESYGVGLRPDGSKGYIVPVEESYWSAVEDWAQGDGISPEQWLRNLLYSAISTYGEPAKGR